MAIIETTPLPAATQKQTLADAAFDGVLAALWRKGLNTDEISLAMGRKNFPEHRIANRLAALRDAGAL